VKFRKKDDGVTPKPVITEEARARILAFVKAVEALQVLYGVTIHADEDIIALRDDKRPDEWTMTDGTVFMRDIGSVGMPDAG
jgi:hypothetical protein